MKRCPRCDKQIRDETVKCRYCNELIDPVSQPQQKIEGIWNKYGYIVAILIIVVVTGMTFINSKTKHDKKEVGYIDVNKEKKDVAEQALEPNNQDLGNDNSQREVNEIRQQQTEEAITRQREMQQQREQQRVEMQQQREQQRVEMEIQQYEKEQQRAEMEQQREQQRIEMRLKQQQQDEIDRLNGKPKYVFKRARRR
jgi:hypothetical protein